MGFLTYREQGSEAVCLPLSKQSTVIGRNQDCDLVLGSLSVSRSHAEIRHVGKKFVLHDLGSSNGITVNGEQCTGRLLRDADEIQIGDYTLVFSIAKLEANAVIPNSPHVLAEVDLNNLPTLSACPASLLQLVRVLGELSVTLDTAETAQELSRGLISMFPSANQALVILHDDDQNLAVSANTQGDGHYDLRPQFSQSVVNWTMESKKAILSLDAGQDDRFLASQSVFDFNIHSVISAPLLGTSSVLGVLYLDRRDIENQFTSLDLEILATIASYAAKSIENARLHQSVEKSCEALELSVSERNIELQASNESLRESIRQRDEFLAMLSHELRNPLAAICNAVAVFNRAPAESEIYLKSLNIMSQQSKHLSVLLDDLLQMSRVTRGAIKIERQRIDLRQVVMESIEAFSLAQECNSQVPGRRDIIIDLPEESVWISGDPTRLQQVCVNLLVNAAKYSSPKGKIWVGLTKLPGQVELTIRDEGVGISPEHLERIFDMFYQLSPTIDRSEGGMGVGLTLTHRIVSLHEGMVSAFSDGKGKGSEFLIQLPLAPQSNDDPIPGNSSSARTIVVVEDQEMVRDTLVSLLRMDGHIVEGAESGELGIQLIVQMRPDIAFIDIGLPGLDGFRVVEHLRELEDLHTRLIALTGYGCGEFECEILKKGFDDHLLKPLRPSDLQAALKESGARSNCTARKAGVATT